MKIQGCDCSIVIKTTHKEFDVPYSEETIRDAYSLLQEEAAIEGDGSCRAIRKKSGVIGCVVTPLTIGTAPLLLYLAFGSAGLPVFVSETRSLYQYRLNLLPMEDSICFDLVQDRGRERNLYEGCRVKGFELRIEHERAIKLKLDICGERSAVAYPYIDTIEPEEEEFFKDDFVTFKINGNEYNNIYGVTLIAKKEGGTKTEIWIRRYSEKENDMPEIIDELIITACLFRDKYEYRYYGQFRIKLERLVLTSDETSINSSGAIIGPLRYYVSGAVTAEVFSSTEGALA